MTLYLGIMKNYKPIFAIILSLLPFCVFAHSLKMPTSAENCSTLPCVRKNIDQIDQQIVVLLGKRLTYVKRAGELKQNKKPIHDQARENRILKKVGKQAEQQGYSADIAQAVFKTILIQSNIYEEKHKNS